MLVMTTYCQVTGARPVFGRSVSHSHKRTSRRWDPNLQRKRYGKVLAQKHLAAKKMTAVLR